MARFLNPERLRVSYPVVVTVFLAAILSVYAVGSGLGALATGPSSDPPSKTIVGVSSVSTADQGTASTTSSATSSVDTSEPRAPATLATTVTSTAASGGSSSLESTTPPIRTGPDG